MDLALATHLSQSLSLPLSTIKDALGAYHHTSSAVEEPIAAYGVQASHILLEDKIDHHQILESISNRHHDSSELLGELFGISELSLKFLAESVFELNAKTLAKYKQESLELPKRISEIAVKLIHLYHAGIEIFSHAKSFNKWLNEPAVGLDFVAPAAYLNTSTGIDYINEELHRISLGYPI